LPIVFSFILDFNNSNNNYTAAGAPDDNNPRRSNRNSNNSPAKYRYKKLTAYRVIGGYEVLSNSNSNNAILPEYIILPYKGYLKIIYKLPLYILRIYFVLN